ncbi:MAG: LPS export ABC transporter periplasmic protein LptC [Candidatus Obscuribacterales bacterium]|nr:LPS export ABC transporter periplasmic protein LptC [Candidatus Obscuribacterales bacterium]
MLSGIFTKLKPFLKLCLALGIVAGLVGSIYLAKQSAEDQMKDFEKNKEQDGAMGSEITVKNYNLREVDGNNKLRWELNAASGVRNGKTADVDLTGIEVKYYNEGQVSFNLSAPVGKASELTHVIVLSSKDGKKVLGLGTEKQTRLETSEME